MNEKTLIIAKIYCPNCKELLEYRTKHKKFFCNKCLSQYDLMLVEHQLKDCEFH